MLNVDEPDEDEEPLVWGAAVVLGCGSGWAAWASATKALKTNKVKRPATRMGLFRGGLKVRRV